MNSYSTSCWSLLLINRPREDEGLSCPCWLRLQWTVYPYKWLPISCRSGAGQWKFAGQRPTFYHWATQPTMCFSDVLLRQKKGREWRESTLHNSIRGIGTEFLWPNALPSMQAMKDEHSTLKGKQSRHPKPVKFTEQRCDVLGLPCQEYKLWGSIYHWLYNLLSWLLVVCVYYSC